MNFEEHVAKPLLADVGITVPEGRLVSGAAEAVEAARLIGPCVVKAQVPTGGRGKAGGIRLASTPDEARTHAEAILGMDINGHRVERLLVEGQVAIREELYAAVLNEPNSRAPVVLFSTMGGIDIEEAAERDPTAVRRTPSTSRSD